MSSYPLLESIAGPKDLKELTVDELPQLATEIRQAICDQVSRSGGHFAPNVGVVELTIALHYVFDFGYDRLLFDVGHQCYPHKLLTGRLDLFKRLRVAGGMAGFPEPRESGYDLFSVGHAGTCVSTATGLALGDQLNGETDRSTVCLVGDSSIVNGLSMEGLNNAGTLKRQFLVVLNDNGMSIGQPEGAIAAYFDRVRINQNYQDFKIRASKMLKHLPGGAALGEMYSRIGEMAKVALTHNHVFEQFGLLCVGPVDGHDLPTLIDILNEVKDVQHPMLLHVKTVKGKGFDFSAGDPTSFHSPKPFKVFSHNHAEIKSGGRSFTKAFSCSLDKLMAKDDKVVAFTAGMPDGTGLASLAKKHPHRIVDVGITESHAVAAAAGMAKAGLKPFVSIYATFMQRSFDQAFQEVSLQNLPVRLCMDRAGMVGEDGAVHHGFTDIAFLRILPGFVCMASIDEPTTDAAMQFMHQLNDRPSALRYPRDNVPTPPQPNTPPFELGKANKLADGEDLSILAYGYPAIDALSAREKLARQGYSVAVYDARFAKPIDQKLVAELIEAGKPILTIEDHGLSAGFGSAVLEAANAMRLPTNTIYRLGHPDRYTYQNTRKAQLTEIGLDGPGIARAIRRILDDAWTPAQIESAVASPVVGAPRS